MLIVEPTIWRDVCSLLDRETNFKNLAKITQQASGRVDHKAHFIQPLVQFLIVNHHLNSARKVLIHFTPCFNLTNGADTGFTQTACAHT